MQIVDKLVEICKYYGFDGWFLNFESEFEESHVSDLLTLIAKLKEKLVAEIPYAELIWYV